MRMMYHAYSHCLYSDLLDFEDGGEDEDDNHNNNNDDDKVNVNQAYSHCLHRWSTGLQVMMKLANK